MAAGCPVAAQDRWAAVADGPAVLLPDGGTVPASGDAGRVAFAHGDSSDAGGVGPGC
ncbi:hypothetical protein [Streptomyces sp. Ag109_G2-15]|uniref:hypothetical protein n=1 Tax=Streptomyces sp. Ag109_G2-15 TaxID=1938850 RepID=UPI0015CF56C1|nr:hypothetical protein [Streptomyces sp. Ag109_G2-15]